MYKKLRLLLIFSKLNVTKLLIDKYRMHNLYAIFAKFLNICKQKAGDLGNKQGNIPRPGVVPRFSEIHDRRKFTARLCKRIRARIVDETDGGEVPPTGSSYYLFFISIITGLESSSNVLAIFSSFPFNSPFSSDSNNEKASISCHAPISPPIGLNTFI